MADLDALKSLHASEIDAIVGYEKALEVADAAKSTLREALDVHRRGHELIHDLLVQMGEKPSESGSFMSSVHKAIITVRSAVSGLDASSLPSFADGEARIADAYAETIRQNADDVRIAAPLKAHEQKVRTLISKMKSQATQVD